VRDALDAVREALKAERPRNGDLRNAMRDITDAIHKDPANANGCAELARLCTCACASRSWPSST
jgi:hypothetical protein